MAFLTECGYRLEARNVRLAGGEIDLIVRDGNVRVFVEVKARRGNMVTGAGAITADKRVRIGRAAALWSARRGVPSGGCRFDVVTIEGRGADFEVRHIPAAFDAPTRWNV